MEQAEVITTLVIIWVRPGQRDPELARTEMGKIG